MRRLQEVGCVCLLAEQALESVLSDESVYI